MFSKPEYTFGGDWQSWGYFREEWKIMYSFELPKLLSFPYCCSNIALSLYYL